MNEIIGAQIVSVPMSVPIAACELYVHGCSCSRWLVYSASYDGMLNVMLYMFVIRRVTRLSKLADEVSLGNLDAGEFQTKSKDEIGVLTEALGPDEDEHGASDQDAG